jgi:branched-chain amino acid aminotransferase
MLDYFSLNGDILPATEAVIPLNNIEYAYGFGVYDSLRLSKGRLLFADEHIGRLLESAAIIDLPHPFTPEQIEKHIKELVEKTGAETCNVKTMLVGGRDKASAGLYIICLNPLFPNRSLYKDGAKVITAEYERPFPHAKTLNMLPSYLAYRRAARFGAYDALSINQGGEITEGTRTNFFAVKGRTIFSPPEDVILPGVTRSKVLDIARQNNFEIKHQPIRLEDIADYDGAFITSTSSKIVPLRSINDFVWSEIDPAIRQLMSAFDNFLDNL